MIGRIVAETRGAIRRVEAKLDGVAAELGHVNNKLMVVSGIVLRLEGREVETVGLKALYHRLARWLAALEAKA